MVKYKKAEDGVFAVVDIKPDSKKRDGIPILICKNDINDELFECHLSYSIKKQKEILLNRELYINKLVYLSYSERSGIKSVPFHIKTVVFQE